MYKALRCSAIFLLFTHLLHGQGTGNNPYSRYGLGELSTQYGSVRNIGMGYSGVAGRPYYNTQFNLHTLNPAHLGYFRKVVRTESTTKFEMGFNTQYRNLSTSDSKQSSFGTNLAYLSIAFPISKTWGTAVGIRPFSTVDYSINTESDLNGSALTTRSEGRGGIYKIYWANGVGLTKWATLGLESSLLYGNISDMVVSNIATLNTIYSGFKVRNQYSGWQLKPGLSMHKELYYKRHDSIEVVTASGIVKKDTIRSVSTNYIISSGITYDFFPSLDLNRSVNLFSVTSTNSILDDSTVSKSSHGLTMPGMLKAGLSLERKFSPKTNYSWMLNADLCLTNWSVLNGSGENGLSGTGLEDDTLFDTWGLNIGGEFTPGIKRRSKTYRLGFAYTQLPVKIQGQTLNDMSFSIGSSIPFGKLKKTETGQQVLPRINLALVMGQRGTTSYGLMKENYFRLYASLLINEIWFQKRKID